MRKFTIWLSCLFLIASMGFANAQTKTITGKVTSSEDGLPIPGVTVMVPGTTVGTTTDFDGNYSLAVNQSVTTLRFSYIGMEPQDVEIGDRTVINVVLAPSSTTLDEVVVVGYGTSTKQSFVGTIKKVTNEEMKAKSVSNLSQSLAGEAAGVRVINTSGQPGSAATIRIRGFGSVNGNRAPLYVLDGVPYTGDIAAINPNDIESTTILKDATATAIYGSRGANGVILMTTKSGKIGKSEIEVDVKTGINVSSIPRHSVIKDPEQYIGLAWEGLYNKGVANGLLDPVAYANDNLFTTATQQYNLWNVANVSELIDPITHTVRDGVTRKYNPENWEDYGFQASKRLEANITIKGGDEKTKYFTSFGYLNDVGYIINSDYERYTATINLKHIVRDWLTVNTKMTYTGWESTNNGQSSDSGSIFWFVDNLPPIFPLFLRDEAGDIVQDPIWGGPQYDYGVGRAFGALTNSIADAHFDKDYTKSHSINGNFGINIRFTEWLTLENTLGMRYTNEVRTIFNNPFYGSAAGQGGYVYKRRRQYSDYNFLTLLRFQKSFGEHNFEALAAHESNAWERETAIASKSRLAHPDIDDLANFISTSGQPTSYTDKVALESYFGQANYNYQSKYYLTASIRRDGSAKFREGKKWDTFGSVGASWILSEEEFMQSISFIDYLKFKASYGLVGEQAGVGYYPTIIENWVGNLNDSLYVNEQNIGNPLLTWETSKMFQTGVEFSVGKYVDASIDYYIKTTTDLLFDRQLGSSIGYSEILVNDGLMRNSGLEFDITGHIINTNDFTLDLTINGELMKNELIDMPIDPATGEQKILDIQGRYGRSAGHSIYDYYLKEWAGVDPADGVGMWYMYYDDANQNGVLDASENAISSLHEYQSLNPEAVIAKTTTKNYSNGTQKYIGKSAIPKVSGAFRINATYKNFDLSAQFIYGLGAYAYDYLYALLMDNGTVGNNNWHTDILKRWQKPGDITDVPRLSDNLDTNVYRNSTRFLEKGDYLALNNLRIGYTFPKKLINRLGISSLSVYLAGDNLFLLSARDGFNPATAEEGTSNTYRYNPLTTYTFGLNVKF